MNEYEVIADVRRSLGKGENRRLRRAGVVPGVLYGEKMDSVPLALEGRRIWKQLENEAFSAHILTVKVDGEEAQAVLRDVQRDPASGKVTHVDFLRVSATNEITMSVPLHFANEEECPGHNAGGVVTHLVVEVEISCLPKHLPEYLEVDLAPLDIGDSVHLSEIKLPEGVTLTAFAQGYDHDSDQPVVSIQHAQAYDVEEEEGAEGEELEAVGEEGEEAEGDAEASEGASDGESEES